MTVLVLDRDFTDPNGEFARPYALGPEDAELVRPDGYVYVGGTDGPAGRGGRDP